MSSLFTRAAGAPKPAPEAAEDPADRNAHRRDLAAWDTTMFDVASCHRTEISCGVFEVEAAGVTHRPETWPQVVRNKIEQHIEEFRAARPDAQIRCVSYGATKIRGNLQCCVILHYAAAKS